MQNPAASVSSYLASYVLWGFEPWLSGHNTQSQPLKWLVLD